MRRLLFEQEENNIDDRKTHLKYVPSSPIPLSHRKFICSLADIIRPPWAILALQFGLIVPRGMYRRQRINNNTNTHYWCVHFTHMMVGVLASEFKHVPKSICFVRVCCCISSSMESTVDKRMRAGRYTNAHRSCRAPLKHNFFINKKYKIICVFEAIQPTPFVSLRVYNMSAYCSIYP